MVRKKIDNRIRVLIENGVKIGHRTMFVIVGDKGKDQVMILHHMLSKVAVRARPSVLWCYKKELGFTTHRKKRMKQIQRKIKSGKMNVNEDDPFELFIASTNIRYCYYSETQKILGNTYGMCVLQDFEALTPNLLARTVETVEGGGLIVILLRSVSSLKQLYTMAMDVHDRYRTEAHSDVVGRFNERFILSLSTCTRCVVVDDQLTVLPISSHISNVSEESERSNPQNPSDVELKGLKESLRDTQPVGCLIQCCRTLDQAKAVLKFIDAISEKTLSSTVSLTASRGRGKSAALGLGVAAAVAFGYANIFVTSPSPDNLKTFFEFVFKGFDALGYKEHLDYGLVQSTNPEYNKALVRVNVFRDNRQTIQFIHPTDAHKLSHAELLVIDEAAAIPLPFVKTMLGPYLVFLASTINGYEGTGRSLSLKLFQQLRNQSSNTGGDASKPLAGRSFYEIVLEESIRYSPGDDIEKWLTDLLCLDSTAAQLITSGIPPPDDCELYYINRDTLFCYHKASEAFLQKIVALYVASHYKNSPNDLQMMSDAPAHHLFCLLAPVNPQQLNLPEVLCVIQVCLEGQISSGSVSDSMSRGKRASGDLIPWTLVQQFQDQEFPSLSGARIVRIATHPDYQSMGYGSRALSLLKAYYEHQFTSLDSEGVVAYKRQEAVPSGSDDLLSERIEPRSSLPPLLLKVTERPAEKLDYLGVSYGVTAPLLKFWKRSGFVPVYIRQTPNELTGEHTCIMLYTPGETVSEWLPQFWKDFRKRFLSLLSYQFRNFPTTLAMSIAFNKKVEDEIHSLTEHELDFYFNSYDIKRLELYCNNLVDYHLIMDLMPSIAKLYFLQQFGDTKCSALQSAILLGIGLQHKNVDEISKELDIPVSQLMGLFNRAMRKITTYITSVLESSAKESLGLKDAPSSSMNPLLESLSHELETEANKLKAKQKKELKKLQHEDFSIRGSEEEWSKALEKGEKGVISIKTKVKNVDFSSKEIEGLELPKKKKKKM